jgi:hypothetical protein
VEKKQKPGTLLELAASVLTSVPRFLCCPFDLNAKIGKILEALAMLICPNCRKENIQPDGTYCSFCGSILQKDTAILQPGLSAADTSRKDSESFQPAGYLQRLEKVTNRLNRMSYVVAAEAVALAALLIFLYYTLYG